MNCAPGIPESYTCYSYNDLKKIAEAYTKTTGRIIYNPQMTKKELWNAIHSTARTICNYNDVCLLTLPSSKQNLQTTMIHHRTFLPNKPTSDYLYTSDIFNVLSQFQNKYRDFLFIGPTPADIYPLLKSSTNNNDATFLEKLIRHGFKKIGIVFNHDVHTGAGTHWVPIYIDLFPLFKNHQIAIEYCDSYGKQPTARILKWINLIKENIEKTMDIHVIIKINSTNHQQDDNTNCGIYSINFILKRLEGMSFEDYTKKDWSYEYIEKFKTSLFIH
jgi:hypothetical protein